MSNKTVTIGSTSDSRFTAKLIKEAGTLDEKVAIVRTRLVNAMKDRKIPFKNIRQAILKDLKAEGIYRKQHDTKTGKHFYPKFDWYLKKNEKWAHDVRRTVSWIANEWTNYGEKKLPVELTTAEKKAHELKKITNAWKVISNLFCDTEDDALKSHMSAIDSIIKGM